MNLRLHAHALLASFAMIATSAFVVDQASGQETMTTGDGLLQLTASMPDEVRVGEQFTYDVQVQNTSDNVTLHQIKLKQKKAEGFSIESVSMQSNENKQQDDSKSESSEKGSSNSGTINISKLMPGESRTVKVTAAADQEGELRSCLEVASYSPAMCLTSQVVKPELELTKTAPKRANRCQMIELEYAVKNGGSGDVGKFIVTDDLGDGLATIEGNSTLNFDVDGLPAGETRKFVARVYAKEPGEFSSRAIAKASDSDMKSRSKQTTTKVVAADLSAKIEGPNRLYGDQLARFTATITNTGNVAAEDVRVNVKWPQNANLVDRGDYKKMKSNGASGNNSNKNGQQEPTVANKSSNSNKNSNSNKSSSSNKNSKSNSNKNSNSAQNSNSNSKKNNSNSNSGNSSGSDDSMNMSEEGFAIDRLNPGQSAQFEYAIRPGDMEELPTKVEARYVCAVDAAEGQAEAKAEAMAMAMTTAKIVRLPAMQLMVIDDEDPVSMGSNVTYTIRVWNEGDAPDQNVQLTAELPDQLKFVSADGPTKNSADGSTITFEPIKTMKSGERADYSITAKSNGNGNVRFEAKLKSKMLGQEVTSDEPTRLFNQQASNN